MYSIDDSAMTMAAPISRAVALSGISRSSIYRLAGEGRIRMLKLGRSSLVDMTSVRDFLATLPAANVAAPKENA